MIDNKTLLKLYREQLQYLKTKPYSKQNMKMIKNTLESIRKLKLAIQKEEINNDQ